MNKVIDQISEAVNALLPKELAEDAKSNIKAGISDALDRFDLVTREELEVQEALLKRTREKLEHLEQQVSELEERTKSQ